MVLDSLRRSDGRIKSFGKSKVFGIGCNKTATTSLKKAMAELGYVTGDQRTAERLFNDWVKRDFARIVNYCKTAQFFQDIPFSLPFTYIAMDQAFPGSKFILTVRNSPDQWYNSVVNYDIKKWGLNGHLPTKKDMLNAEYIHKSWIWEVHNMTYEISNDELYNKAKLMRFYNEHNDSILKYFRGRPEDLLVLNVAEDNSYKKLCDFLKLEPVREKFPWENKSTNI